MADNYAKLWLQKNTNQQAITRAQQVIKKTGRALPCSVVSVNGSIVTVKFEVDAGKFTLPQIKIPIAQSKWMRMPIQPGDKGMTVPADASIAGISGLGTGVATLTSQGNLSSLQFIPCGSSDYPSVNQNAAYISGPEGAVIETEDGTSKIEVSTSGITLTFGGKVVTLNSTGFMIDGILFETHMHSLVQTGSSDSGPPVP